jgi:hypothetical protein
MAFLDCRLWAARWGAGLTLIAKKYPLGSVDERAAPC